MTQTGSNATKESIKDHVSGIHGDRSDVGVEISTSIIPNMWCIRTDQHRYRVIKFKNRMTTITYHAEDVHLS